MFRILKFDDDFVYLSHPDGRLKKIDRTLFDFDIKLGNVLLDQCNVIKH